MHESPRQKYQASLWPLAWRAASSQLTHFLLFFSNEAILQLMRSCTVASSLSRRHIERSQSISLQPPLPDDIVLRLSYLALTFQRNQTGGRTAGQGVLVCLLSEIDVNEERNKCISAVAPTLSRASISSNSVAKSNTLTHQRAFPLLVCLLLQVILFGQSESGKSW